MLAFVRGAETVLADMETLNLEQRFPVVVLASNFINDPDTRTRRAFLECCARHVCSRADRCSFRAIPRDWAPSTDWSQHGRRPVPATAL